MEHPFFNNRPKRLVQRRQSLTPQAIRQRRLSRGATQTSLLKAADVNEKDDKYFKKLNLGTSLEPDVKKFLGLLLQIPRAQWLYYLENYLILPLKVNTRNICNSIVFLGCEGNKPGKISWQLRFLQILAPPEVIKVQRRVSLGTTTPTEETNDYDEAQEVDDSRLQSLLFIVYNLVHQHIILNGECQKRIKKVFKPKESPMAFTMLQTRQAFELMFGWSVRSLDIVRMVYFSFFFSLPELKDQLFKDLCNPKRHFVWESIMDVIASVESFTLLSPERPPGVPRYEKKKETISIHWDDVYCGIDRRLILKIFTFLNTFDVLRLGKMPNTIKKVRKMCERIDAEGKYLFLLAGYLRMLEMNHSDQVLIHGLAKVVKSRPISKQIDTSRKSIEKQLGRLFELLRWRRTISTELQKRSELAHDLYLGDIRLGVNITQTNKIKKVSYNQGIKSMVKRKQEQRKEELRTVLDVLQKAKVIDKPIEGHRHQRSQPSTDLRKLVLDHQQKEGIQLQAVQLAPEEEKIPSVLNNSDTTALTTLLHRKKKQLKLRNKLNFAIKATGIGELKKRKQGHNRKIKSYINDKMLDNDHLEQSAPSEMMMSTF